MFYSVVANRRQPGMGNGEEASVCICVPGLLYYEGRERNCVDAFAASSVVGGKEECAYALMVSSVVGVQMRVCVCLLYTSPSPRDS